MIYKACKVSYLCWNLNAIKLIDDRIDLIFVHENFDKSLKSFRWFFKEFSEVKIYLHLLINGLKVFSFLKHHVSHFFLLD